MSLEDNLMVNKSLSELSINVPAEESNELKFNPKKKNLRKGRAAAAATMAKIPDESAQSALNNSNESENLNFEKSLDSEHNAVTAKAMEDSWLNSDRDYYYSELIAWIYEKIVADKNLGGLKGVKKSIEPPEVGKIGTKKIAWVNFVNNCKSISRKSEHVLDFVLTELGAQGSISSDGKLIIKGRFQSKQLENVLRRYIAEYVVCRTCRSGNTDLKKENRITFKVCKDCSATSSVTNIKQGFRVQTKRKK